MSMCVNMHDIHIGLDVMINLTILYKSLLDSDLF